MRHTGCRENAHKYAEEVKEFEGELEERHRQQMREEMRAYLEVLDRKASEELVKRGGICEQGAEGAHDSDECGETLASPGFTLYILRANKP